MGRRSTRTDSVPRLRVRRKSSGILYYYYDHGGQPRREEPLGSDYGIAIQKWAEYERSRVAAEKVAEVITFRYVAERYRRMVIPTKAPKTQTDNAKELANLLAFFDDPPAPLDMIKPVNVRQYLTWRTAPKPRFTKDGKPVKTTGSGAVRAKREKALLSHIWNFARDEGLTNLSNPCAGIRGAKERARAIYVDDDLLLAVRNEADQPLRDVLDLAYLCGQRPGDILRMDERHIKDKAIEFRQGKTGMPLRIEIEGELAILLERIAERKRQIKKEEGKVRYISSTRLAVDEEGQALSVGQLRYRFDKARERAGVSFQIRDLRAKAGTDKTESSGDIRQAQQQLGHTSVVMTEAYVRRRRGAKVKPTR